MKIPTILFVLLLWSPALISGAPKCPDLPVQQGSYVNGARPAEHKDLTIVSLNLAKEKAHDKILRDLRKTPVFETADIWLFQEAVKTIPEIARTMGLNYVYAPTEDSGLAILSRYPIGDPERIPLSQHNLIFRSRCRIALSARIESLEVVNVHLDTRIGKQQRLDQASPLLNGDRRIVGGDFNTANVRWIMHLLPVPGPNHSRAMRDMFVAQGFESPLDHAGATFKLLHLPLHLDWIFPKDLKAVAAGVEKIDFSDHHAVWVALGPGDARR